MLVEFWKDSLKISMIEISSEDDESIRVCCLFFTDGLIQFTTCRIPARVSLLVEAGGMYTATSKIAVKSLGRYKRRHLMIINSSQW